MRLNPQEITLYFITPEDTLTEYRISEYRTLYFSFMDQDIMLRTDKDATKQYKSEQRKITL